jgi:23S rRNA (guanosine2251-2'-O)-methyltransferase
MQPIKRDFYLICHNIRSLHNVGSVFRTADAFGITKIFLTGYTGTPEHPFHSSKLLKVSLGAEKFVSWEYKKSAVRVIKDLKLKGFRIVALENNVKAKKLTSYKPKFPLVLILGEEVKGIKKNILELCDDIVEIPMRGQKESLNVSVAFGVAAYEISK